MDEPISPVPASSSKLGSPDGLFLNLMGQVTAPQQWRNKFNEIHLQLPLFLQNTSRIENCVQMLSQTAPPDIKQIYGRFVARVTSLETNTTLAQAATRQDLGTHSNMAQPLDLSGPMDLGHLMTLETQDKGLIRSQALKMNKREVPCYFDSIAND